MHGQDRDKYQPLDAGDERRGLVYIRHREIGEWEITGRWISGGEIQRSSGTEAAWGLTRGGGGFGGG